MDKVQSSGLSLLATACMLLIFPGSMIAQSAPEPGAAASEGHGAPVGSPDTDRPDTDRQGISASRAPSEVPENKKVVATSLPLGMIRVPGGSIQLGISARELEEIVKFGKTKAERNKIRRSLTRELGDEKRTVQPYYLGKHELTNRQYHVFIKATWPAHRFPFQWWTQEDIDKKRDEAHEKWLARKKAGERVPNFEFDVIEYWDKHWANLEWALPEKIADQPVGFVTYDDARAFCTWAGVRLPTQAEWQLAFGGDRYIWGPKWDSRLKPDKFLVSAGKGAYGTTKLGFTEMMSNVWEWVDERFHALKGYDNAYVELRRIWNKKKIDSNKFLTPVFSDKRIIMGGCVDNWPNAPVVYRRQSRVALSEDNRAELLGFRLAKSITPAIDTTILRYRYDFAKESLLGHELDLPNIKQRKAMRAGRTFNFRIRGGERWDLVDGLIHGYHMVSVVPIKAIKPIAETPPKDAKVWKTWTSKFGKTGEHGLPLAAIFTTEKIWFNTKDVKGKTGKLDLDAGMFVTYYRGKGVPDELHYAMLAGGMELRSNKGKRKDEEQKKREAEKKAKADEKAKAKKGNLKKPSKKKKKGKKRRSKKKKKKKKSRSAASGSQAKLIQQAAATWKKVVDAYEVDDKISKEYPKKKRPQMIRIQPGNLLIPVDRDILLIRSDKGNYLGWIPIRKPLSLRSKGETRFGADAATGTISYTGFLKFNDRKVLPFALQFHMSAEELTKPWVFDK